ncbi:hypothetical protein CDV55_103304 [Aspergillus turcosus]|uniref:Uncharacterized protein n=1 Tax=Aspergillus turcosus TaxID=1245748 RepID=A0A229YV72_9EURO|nr:hypothetical protein CDV55_103304 [Aspergillus turcosus]RLL94811.1 hypothetical protein CFD26_103600 [Aspergillus turcosus]
MSTVIRSGRNASIDALKGASGSGGKHPRKGNGGRRPPRDRPAISKKRRADACLLCKRTDHSTANCPNGAIFLNEAQFPPRPRDCRHANRPVTPAPRRCPRQQGPTARDRRRAIRQARRKDTEQAPEREEPREDIEEEPQEHLPPEREQTG